MNTIKDLHDLAARFAIDTKSPHVILLNGELGSGKTEWTRGFCAALGIKNVSSPSFSLQNQYQNENIRVYHFDLYRTESEAEIDSTGIWDTLAHLDGYAIIEWSNRISQSQIPKNLKVTEFKWQSQNQINETNLFTTPL